MQNIVKLSQLEGGKNRTSLVILTILFFMWGLLTSLNDVLIPHLKSIYTLTYVQAMLVQFCFFGAYFIVSIPAGSLIKKIGYQHGVVVGLLVAALGCVLFYPASLTNYGVFLLAFFILAAGITILQVAANPYVTVLGNPETASSRLTLTQAFNALGTAVAPWLGGILILSAGVLTHAEVLSLSDSDQVIYRAKEAATVQGPYLALAVVLLIMAVLFFFAKLPHVNHNDAPKNEQELVWGEQVSVMEYRHLVLGAIGIFLYVGAEVSIGSFLISFLGTSQIASLSPSQAAHYVSYYWGGAMFGRFIGFAVMRYVSPGKALAANACCSILLILTAIFSHGSVAMWSIIAVGLCNSIMFPTIFSMALNKLGKFTGQGSGILCMSIVGGAIVPFFQGFLADNIGLQWSFFIPAACYLFILFFGLKYADMYNEELSPK